tara:strand:- start:479 stop:1408 length:930 start_codon:yes stop_codon:yes gene_type:complete
MKSIKDYFNDISKNLNVSNNITQDEFILEINEFTFNFPLKSKADNTNLGYMQPKDWLINEHKKNNLHEPGLVILLLALGKKFQDTKIRFWDIGALYGYFSILASKIFKDVEVFSIEANPFSCKYIESIDQDSEFIRHEVINTFIDTKSTKKQKKYIYGYRFLSTNEYVQILLKNIVKNFVNLFKKKYQVVKPEKILIGQSSLSDLLGNNKQSIDVLKIDTEGYQALFLPSVSQTLIDHKSIILLEFDDAKDLGRFNSSNQKLCTPFLESGYKMYWLDHRVKGASLEVKTKVEASMEINSLALLIPSEFN